MGQWRERWDKEIQLGQSLAAAGNGRGSRIHASTFWQQGEVLESETLTDQELAAGSVGDKVSVCSHPGDEGDVAPQGCCPPAGSLRELDNEKAQRLQLLEVRNTGISEVHKWISQNRDQFRGQVGAAILGGETSALPRASPPARLGMRIPSECLQLRNFSRRKSPQRMRQCDWYVQLI